MGDEFDPMKQIHPVFLFVLFRPWTNIYHPAKLSILLRIRATASTYEPLPNNKEKISRIKLCFTGLERTNWREIVEWPIRALQTSMV